MGAINWYVWAGLWLVAWFWQNLFHEWSHLATGWIWEGRKPIRMIPWPHKWQGRWYWARYEGGPATRANAAQQEYRRHSAPLRWAVVQMWCVGAGILGWLGAGWLVSWEMGLEMSWYSVPFFVCPLVDAAVWIWGYVMRRPGTDGDRWRQAGGRW